MAYGLRYTITQKLRDDTTQVVNIYEKGYVLTSVKTYEATSITLLPNTADEDATASVISSQLNINFVISTESDYLNFPDLLNDDDTKYYVELLISDAVRWKGFLFNDYINIAFTTGNQQVNMVCVDGLSLLKYNIFDLTQNTNELVLLLNVIGNCLNRLPFKNAPTLYACCSYYSTPMLNRGNGGQYEPFGQAYQYLRDINDLDCYTILDNIVKSFGCRLFQANGDWYILPMNQMATTIYFTQYSVTDTPALISYGTIVNTVTIEPYAEGNIHFIDNTQVKIIKKGYQVINCSTNFNYVDNFLYNGYFKKVSSGDALGWYKSTSGAGTVTLSVDNTSDSNIYTIKGNGSGTAQLTNKVPLPLDQYTGCPYMYGPSIELSFDFSPDASGNKIKLYIECKRGSTLYYYDASGAWTTTANFIAVDANVYGTLYERKTFQIPLGLLQAPTNNLVLGKIGITFLADSSPNLGGKIKNVKLTQASSGINSVNYKRQIGTSNYIAKDSEVIYGGYNPNGGQNCIGTLLQPSSPDNTILFHWYRYGKPAENFSSLAGLVARQYSNLLNKNIATLEGDLGNYNADGSLTYLDKTYLVQDDSTNSISYNGKKFLMNRMTLDAYNQEVNQIQLIEITNDDNASTETITYSGTIKLI